MPTFARLAIVLLGLALTGCPKHSPAPADAEKTLPKEPASIRVARVERGALRPALDLAGPLLAIPERTAVVAPQTAGSILKVLVAEGAAVQAGATLVEFDPRVAEADLEKAAASLSEKTAVLERLKHGPRPEEIEIARHDVHKAQVAVEALAGEVGAMKNLRSNNEVSTAQFQKTEAALQTAENENAAAEARLKLLQAGTRPEEIAEAEARLAVAKAELAAAKLNVQLCKISSPIEGTVTQLPARQGMYAQRSTPLVTIVDLSKLFLQVRIPSAFLAKLKIGAKVDVRITALPDKTYTGAIARISGQADAVSGDVEALVQVANSEGVLRPGLACRARVWLPEIPQALAIPLAAVSTRSGAASVRVIRNARSHEIPVKLGAQTHDKAQVLEGLAEGEQVIVEGGDHLPAGCPVQVRTESGGIRKPGAHR